MKTINFGKILMIGLIILMELLLIGLNLKEVYDIVFLEESERKFEFEKNRTQYIEKQDKPIFDDL